MLVRSSLLRVIVCQVAMQAFRVDPEHQKDLHEHSSVNVRCGLQYSRIITLTETGVAGKVSSANGSDKVATSPSPQGDSKMTLKCTQPHKACVDPHQGTPAVVVCNRCVCVCVRACVRASVCVCVRMCVNASEWRQSRHHALGEQDDSNTHLNH
jgi:hypothetical protein